jgi:hypothetical protein
VCEDDRIFQDVHGPVIAVVVEPAGERRPRPGRRAGDPRVAVTHAERSVTAA